jgi:hypothetical protein
MVKSVNLLPVTFELHHVSANFCVQITLDTPGVAWTIERCEGDLDLGFSCNEGAISHPQAVSVQSIELTKSTLSILTGVDSGESVVTITASLYVADDVKSLQGHCILNDGAMIFVRLGCGPAIEWTQGRITANVPGEVDNLTFISLAIGGWGKGRSVTVELIGNGEDSIRWALGSGTRNTSPFTMYAANGGVVRVGSVSFLPRSIELFSCEGEIGGSPGTIDDLRIEVYIERLDVDDSGRRAKPGHFSLCARCDPDVVVVAQLPGQYPQYLTSAPTIFPLN